MAQQGIQKAGWLSSLKALITGNKFKDKVIISSHAKSDTSTSVITQAQTVPIQLPDRKWLDDVEINIPPGIVRSEYAIAILRSGPEDYDYVYFDGECDNSIPLRQIASKIATEAISDLPDNQSLLGSLGFALIELAEYEKALKCFMQQSECSPDDGTAWNNMAWCMMQLGRYGEALASCDKALKYLSNHSHVHHDHASILVKLGKLDEAAAVINNAILNIKPQAPQLHYLLADIKEKQGDIKAAVTQWKTYLEFVDNKAGHERAKLRVQSKLQKCGERISLKIPVRYDTEDYTTLFNSYVMCHMLCLNQYMQLGQKASGWITRADKLKISNFIEKLLGYHIDIFYELSRKAKRLPKEHKEIIARHYVFLALADLLQEDLDGVEDLLNKSLKLNENSIEAKALLQAYYVIKVMQGVSEDEEYKLLKSAIKIDPRPGHAQILLARHYCFKKKYGEIDNIFAQVKKSALEVRGTDGYDLALVAEAEFGVLLWKAVGRIMDNKDSEALSILTDLKTRRPNFPEVKYWLAIINIRQGSYTKAKEILDTIPSGAIPDKTLSELKSIIHKRIRISDSDHDDIFNLRSPRMTGTSSSPISVRRF